MKMSNTALTTLPSIAPSESSPVLSSAEFPRASSMQVKSLQGQLFKNVRPASNPTVYAKMEDKYLHAYFSSLNLIELPEMVIVDTKFTTEPNSIPTTFDVMYTMDTTVKQENIIDPPLVNIPSVQPLVGLPELPPSQPLVSNASTLTDSPNPKRDRAQQTDTTDKSLVTVGVQCNLDYDYDETVMNEICESSNKSTGNEKEIFIKFVNQKTQLYSNGKRECLICGEIKPDTKIMYTHMAMHWGPPVLCYHCGIRYEHEALFSKHVCKYRAKLRRKSGTPYYHQLKCPHFFCKVTAISPLELYDHINEHSGHRCYRCLGCWRAFHTAGELRHHLAIRLKCLEGAKRQRLPYKPFHTRQQTAYRARVLSVYSFKKKLVLVKSFLSQISRSSKRCQICLKYCSNGFKYSRHSKRCMKNFLYRLDKKRSKQPTIQNGSSQ